MIAPTGKIKICVPGRTKGAAAEAAEVASLVAFAWSAKTPLTKVASLEASVVLVVAPEEETADKVTTGMTRPWRTELMDIMLV